MRKRLLPVTLLLVACSTDAVLPDAALPDDLASASPADLSAPVDLSATPTQNGPLRVGTLNLHCLFDSPDTRFDGIAQEVLSRNLDAIGLEEVCQKIGEGGSDNAALKLAGKLTAQSGIEWDWYWVKTHAAWSNTYDEGLAIVARKGALGQNGQMDLTSTDGLARKIVWAQVATDRGAFFLYVNHLSISSNDQDRIDEVGEILSVVGAHAASGLPQIVVGDFNSTPSTAAIQKMLAGPPSFIDSFAMKNPGQSGFTVPVPNPTSRIDYVFIASPSLKTLSQAQVSFSAQYLGVWPSDHFGVTAELYAK